MKYDTLYDEHEDLMTAPDFDRIISTARIMGRDIYALMHKNEPAIGQIKKVLVRETSD